MKLMSDRSTMIFRPYRSARRPQNGESRAVSAGVTPRLSPDQSAIAPTSVTPSCWKYSGRNGITSVKPVKPMKHAAVTANRLRRQFRAGTSTPARGQVQGRPDRHSFDRRQFAPRRPILAVAEDIIGLHDLVNLAGALVDDRSLAIAVEPSDGVLVRVPVGAVHLHGIAGRPLRCHRGEPLRKAGFARVAAPVVLQEP